MVRLMHFRKVVLPEFAGPMMAKMHRRGTVRFSSLSAGFVP